MDDLPVFKASKKRKVNRYQHREVEEQSQELVSEVQNPASITLDAENLSDQESSVAKFIRSRNQKARRGLRFGSDRRAKDSKKEHETSDMMALAKASPPVEDPLKDISSRFTTSIGHVVDIDQHMIEYIETQMGQQRNQSNVGSSKTNYPNAHHSGGELSEDEDEEEDEHQFYSGGVDSTRGISDNKNNTRATIPTHNQPYHLAEVSLSSLPAAVQPKPSQKSQSRPPKKQKYIYLDRKGNPLPPRPPRPRKRQNSIDQARDMLVEQVLSENKLQESQPPLGSGTGLIADPSTSAVRGMNEDADEKLAADFRREFFEGQAERKKARQSQQASHAASRKNAAGGSGGTGGPDGPKLGGSRSARAKMHAALQAEKEKAKGK